MDENEMPPPSPHIDPVDRETAHPTVLETLSPEVIEPELRHLTETIAAGKQAQADRERLISIVRAADPQTWTQSRIAQACDMTQAAVSKIDVKARRRESSVPWLLGRMFGLADLAVLPQDRSQQAMTWTSRMWRAGPSVSVASAGRLAEILRGNAKWLTHHRPDRAQEYADALADIEERVTTPRDDEPEHHRKARGLLAAAFAGRRSGQAQQVRLATESDVETCTVGQAEQQRAINHWQSTQQGEAA